MKKPTVYLADLRHDYQGILSTDTMPLSVGYMKAVMNKNLPEVNSILFAYPEKLISAIKQHPPDVLMLSNYMWNERLTLYFAKLAKTIRPETLVIVGGPNIAIEDERKVVYIERHPEIDLYATGEGDFYATEVVQKFLNHGMELKKLLQENLHSTVYKYNSEQVITTPIAPRSRQLDEIPSPWLSGILDEFFDGKLAPLFETNRGCPFTCTFCVQGTKWYSKINYFSRERLREEIHYIGKKIQKKCPQQKLLHIADSNYGMYEQDIDVSTYLGEVQKLYNWPLIIDATTGKNKAELIIKNIEKLNGAMVMYQAVQSLDEIVLENVKRNNINLDAYAKIQVHIRGRGLRSNSDLILGLPGESLESHITSLKKLINSGTHRLNNFQAMMLHGSELEKAEIREKYGFVTKFRMLPKCFGEYNAEKVMELDEIIVSSNTLTFDDYLRARLYHFVISLFWNDSRFESIVKFLEHHGYQKWDFIRYIYDFLTDAENNLKSLVNSFIEETKTELFDSAEQATTFYNCPKNFECATQSEIGDNLMYKYRALAMYWYWEPICNFVFDTLVKLTHKLPSSEFQTQEWLSFTDDWKKVIFNSYIHGKSESEILSDTKIQLNYDVIAWLEDGCSSSFMLFENKTPVVLKCALSNDNYTNLAGAIKIWNYDYISLPMVVRRIHFDWQKKTIKRVTQTTIEKDVPIEQ